MPESNIASEARLLLDQGLRNVALTHRDSQLSRLLRRHSWYGRDALEQGDMILPLAVV